MIHELILKEVVSFLHSTFPDASIGVSGSVAAGTYRADSDVDLLFQQKGAKQNFQISFLYRGIKVSVFSFSKEMLYNNERKYLFMHHNMPITYISDTNVLYDSERGIEELKDFVQDIVTRRVLLKQILISNLKDEIAYLFQQSTNALIEEKKRCYNIVNKIIAIFFLKRYADKVIRKKEGHNPFVTIMNDDRVLYVKLQECLPYHSDSIKYLELLFKNYILTFY